MPKLNVFLLGILFATTTLFSQQNKPLTPSEIHTNIQKLNFLGTALYVAAHPDDENTRLISYLDNHVKARTAYLSLTRGDGGQNLIGPELRELLGVLRTQELLAARNVDGGEQLFTRANDFGYSKHPDETHAIWNKEEVLGDVVWAIRNFRPDVIINRFDHKNPGTTHGHHTSSAMLSMEAFDLVNNANAYPEQLTKTKTWQPRRLFFNTSWWFYGSQENFEKADKSKMLSFDVGVYYPSLGLSNNEIASIASSQHLCQGFGRINTRGSQKEYVELLKGDLPEDKNNLFDGINTTWTRVKGGKAIQNILENVENNFNFHDPSNHLNDLVKAHQLIKNIEDDYWRIYKLQEIENIIAAVTGLYVEATSTSASTVPGSAIKINLEALNRSNANIQLVSAKAHPTNTTISINTPLKNNKKELYTIETTLANNMGYSAPYWLMEEGTLGMYKVNERALIGKPETPRPMQVTFNLSFNGVIIPITRDVVYRFSMPDKGEIYEPFQILPPVVSSINNKVTIFNNGNKQIPVKVKALTSNVSGSVRLQIPDDWRVTPASKDFNIEAKGDETTVIFTLTPPINESEGYISPIVTYNNKTYSQELVEINYDHIPKQSVLLPSKSKVVRLNIEKAGESIGYVIGAGDDVPNSLKQIGYNVRIISPEEITKENLQLFDAVVVGIRAYNVVNELKFKQRFLLDYVEQGGNLIVQYNTGGRRGVDVMAPYTLKISRDRVTNEAAPVKITASNHPLVNFPNKITQKDFEGWTQERGLYFPNEWAPEFTPILSMQDKGETPKNGSLLVAPYGKGYYIYTGLSFFRELPAGVPGAFKLFSNMLSIGKDKITNNEKIKG
jgi:LmbE family N-acetylglucosaminyl deacetylase